MTKKQTSAAVSAIAARVLGDDGPLSPEIQAGIAAAVAECGVPLNDRATLVLTSKIEAALAPLLDEMRSLAASCLSQDETPKPKTSGGFGKPSEPPVVVPFDAGDEELAGN